LQQHHIGILQSNSKQDEELVGQQRFRAPNSYLRVSAYLFSSQILTTDGEISVKWFKPINLDSLRAPKEPPAHHLSIGQYVQ
jgi:hypothetical protein